MFKEYYPISNNQEKRLIIMQNDKDGSFAILKSISPKIISCLKKVDAACKTLPKIHEYGENYIIEESIEGTKLIDIIENENIKFSAVQKMVYDICSALTELHKNNVCHMDISLENIIRAQGGYVLIDYSASLVFGDTVESVSYGTRAFCSPEHFGFDTVSAESDIYSLGKLLKFVLRYVGDCDASVFSDLLEDCNRVDKSKRIASTDVFLKKFEDVCRQHTSSFSNHAIIKEKTKFCSEDYVSTEDVFNALNTANDLVDFINNNEQNFIKFEVLDFFSKVLKEKGLKKSEVIKRSGIERTYGYQLLNGTKRPSRSKLIQLCMGARFGFEETQIALRRTGFAPLYPKNKWDCIIIYAIKSGKSVIETDEILYTFNEPLLNED